MYAVLKTGGKQYKVAENDVIIVEKLAAEEDEILAWAEQGGDLSSDEAFERFEDIEAWCTSMDPGVISTSIALSVVGCCPVSSCIGAAGHSEHHPVVLFWCPSEIWPLVRDIAASTGVSIRGCGEPGITLYTDGDIRPLRVFARRLVEVWGK